VRFAAPLPQDAETFAKWSENADYLRLLNTDPARPLSAERFREAEKKDDSGSFFHFRLRTLADNTLIGFVELEVDWPNQACFLAIGIGEPDYWGQGYGSDALRLALRYAFQELGLHRVGLNVISNNARAIHVYEKTGFTWEGATRQVVYRDGQRLDMIYYGMLREEWVKKHGGE
jgi:RimJ/RimL family protein N-acetyltransferase